MNDSILHDPGTQIDARSLIASEAMRGAIGGFCWSLLVAVPMAWMMWFDPRGGPFWAMIELGGICSIWSAVAALAQKRRSRESTFTPEQLGVLRRHLRRTRTQAACVSVFLIVMTEAFSRGESPVFEPRYLCGMIILSIAISSDLVGRGKGNAAVRAMQRETRDAACRIDAHHPTVTDIPTYSTLVQPSINRITATQPSLPLEDD